MSDVPVRKRIVLIRHGESEYNAWAKRLLTWLTLTRCNDPLLFDARLSPRGRDQVLTLQRSPQFRDLASRTTLVISSPLTRALETATGLFDSSAVRILASALCSEAVDTSCDVGRAVAELADEFPGVDFSRCPPNEWWFSGKNGANVRGGAAVEDEPVAEIRARVEAFKAFLMELPEELVVVVSHSSFIRELTQSRFKLKNCGIMQMEL